MAFVTMEKRPDTAPFPPRPTKARLLPQDALQGSARIEQALGKLKRFERVALRCEKTKRLCNPRSPSPPASSCSNPSTRPRLDTQCVSNLDTELHGPIGAIPRRMITEKRIRDLEAAMAVKAKLRPAPRCWETCKCQKIEWCPMPGYLNSANSTAYRISGHSVVQQFDYLLSESVQPLMASAGGAPCRREVSMPDQTLANHVIPWSPACSLGFPWRLSHTCSTARVNHGHPASF